MNLDNDQKKIWEESKKIKFSNIPDKDEVWQRLVQQMNSINQELDVEKNEHKSKSNKFIAWPNFDFIPKKILVFTLLVIFSIPLSYHYFTINTIITNTGEQEVINLPDKSLITLNYESKIIYDKNFNINDRSVTLIGEAYFQIKKNEIPFTIDTKYGQITVLGTSFNVRSRDDGFEIGVNEGRVKLVSNDFSIELTEGQLFKSKNNPGKNISKISYVGYPGWVNDKFYCKNTTLEDLCSEIERKFNINIRFHSPNLKDITVTGVIQASDFNSVMQTVSLLTQHDFKLEGDTCTIF